MRWTLSSGIRMNCDMGRWWWTYESLIDDSFDFLFVCKSTSHNLDGLILKIWVGVLLVNERVNWEEPFLLEDLWIVIWEGDGGPLGLWFMKKNYLLVHFTQYAQYDMKNYNRWYSIEGYIKLRRNLSSGILVNCNLGRWWWSSRSLIDEIYNLFVWHTI